MNFTLKKIIKTLAQGALGKVSLEAVLRVLEEDLFSSILPEQDISQDVKDNLLDLYEYLEKRSDGDLENIKNSFNSIITEPVLAESIPLLVIEFKLKELLALNFIDYSNAKKLLELPWYAAKKRAHTQQLKEKLNDLYDNLESFVHDVSDGFVADQPEESLLDEIRYLVRLMNNPEFGASEKGRSKVQ